MAGDRASYAERYRRQLIEALERLPHDPMHLVNLLFGLLANGCGEEAARQMFLRQGGQKEPREMQEINNQLLLDAYDLQKKLAERNGRKFYVARFVREYAESNKSLPQAEQRGPGSIDPTNLRQQLLILRRDRDLERVRAQRANAQREIADLRRVREGAVETGDLTMIRQLDKRIEALGRVIAEPLPDNLQDL
jgi:hypothetical protein